MSEVATPEPSLLDGIDSIAAMDPAAPDPIQQPQPAPTQSTTQETAPVATQEQAPAKSAVLDEIPDYKTKPVEKPTAPVVDEEFKNPKELRSAYQARKAELEAARKEIEMAKAGIEEAKRLGATEAEARFKADLEAAKKELSELNEKLKYTDFKSSKEYSERYQLPLQKAWESALADIKDVTVQNEDGTESPATAEHIIMLAKMPALQAAKKATEWFGAAATEIMAHRRTILDLNQKSEQAINDWKTKGAEIAANNEREANERQSRMVEQFDTGIKSLRESAPHIFGPPDDKEALSYFTKGEATVNLALRGEGMPPGLTPEQQAQKRIEAQSIIAAKSIALGPAIYKLNKYEARIKELESELNGYKNSTPKPSSSTAKQGKVVQDIRAEDLIDQLQSGI